MPPAKKIRIPDAYRIRSGAELLALLIASVEEADTEISPRGRARISVELTEDPLMSSNGGPEADGVGAVLTVESDLGLTVTTATQAGRLSTVWVPRSAIRLVADAAGRVASEATS